MTRYLIGIDNGSQSTKVSVFDEHGAVICEGRHALRPGDTPRPGIVEHPEDDLWFSVGVASRRAMRAFPGDFTEIAGVGLCTIRFCRALLKEDGALASPVMSWMDERVSRPYEHSAEDVRYVTTSSGYISHRLTGQFKDTAANYQGMWPISTDRWEWLRGDEGFASYGIPRDMLFDLVMPGQLLGHVTPAASRHTGIPAGLPVVATANDKAVEALGCGLRSSDTLLVSLGTYIASMTTGRQNVAGASSFWSNFASVPHKYLYESLGIRRGMWTVSWWRDLLGGDVLRAAEERGIPLEKYMDLEAAKVTAGSDGLMVVLDWLGPADAPFKKGSMLGFDVRHGPFHVHRAILEGIALTIRRCGMAMGKELGESFSRLVISGGGSRSDLFMHIFADVFGMRAVRGKVANAAALGSAICVAVGQGLYPSWSDAVDKMVSWDPAFAPDARNHGLYQRMSAVYDQIPEATDKIFEQSYRIFG
ncbi:MAG TPA: FGGY-family carbohydrate kinase [Acidimicrobiales bacterium]|nr:FGGY-family carbohydrate kinase [Acidimicrobiales bacterium]